MPRDGDFARDARANAPAPAPRPARSPETIMKQKLTAAQNKAAHNYEVAVLCWDVNRLTMPLIRSFMKSHSDLTRDTGPLGDLQQRTFIGRLMNDFANWETDVDRTALRKGLVEKCEELFGRKLKKQEYDHIMNF